jgi:hypothetical protein
VILIYPPFRHPAFCEAVGEAEKTAGIQKQRGYAEHVIVLDARSEAGMTTK